MAAAGGMTFVTALAPKTSAASSTLKTIALTSSKGFLAGVVISGAIAVASQVLTPMAAPVRQPVSAPIRSDARGASVAMDKGPDPGVPVRGTATPASHAHEGASAVPRSVAGQASALPRSYPAPEARDVSSAPAVPAVDGDLANEIRAFERARRAFASGDAASASRELYAYQRDFAHGTLSLEAEVLRIEILAASGDPAAARARARAFLEAYPSTPAARRVRSVLARLGSEAPK
jgi:hypothetical protein